MRVRVRVLSCKAAAPPTETTLKSYFLRRSFPARACVVRVVVVQWWYVAMCFCVGVFCVFSPPCARWLTIQRYAQKAEFVRVSLSVCLSLCLSVLSLLPAVRPVVHYIEASLLSLLAVIVRRAPHTGQ